MDGECAIDINAMSSVQLNLCNSPGTQGCCTPNVNVEDVCQAKRCKDSLGCNTLGYCEYSDVDVYSGCCSFNVQCPTTAVPALTGADIGTAADLCRVPTCQSTNCNYILDTNCCVTSGDCTLPGSLQTGVCVQGSDTPTGGECALVLEEGVPCTRDEQCQTSNACATSSCVGGTCRTAPFPGGAGCCSASDVSQCAEDVCNVLAPIPCNAEVSQFEGLSILPDFTCNLMDMTEQGCCTNSFGCEASSNACFSSVCSQATNQCVLNDRDPSTGDRCCYISADCGEVGAFGIRDTDDLCVYSECENFRCVERSTTGCPGSPPSDGLIPTLALGSQSTSCDWDCAAASNNNILTTYTVSNPLASGRVLYGLDLMLHADNGIAARTIQSITVVSTSVNTPTRDVPVGLFGGGGATTIDGGSFEQTFESTEPYSLHPGETLTVTFETVFIGDASSTSFDFLLRVIPYDVCVDYWLGQANCMSQDDIASGNRLVRSMQMGAAISLTFMNDPCDPQCLGGTLSTTTTATGTGAPTEPPSEPVGTVQTQRTHQHEVTIELAGCNWSCDDDTDTRQNILSFDISETLLTGAAKASDEYRFIVLLETSCGQRTIREESAFPSTSLFTAASIPGDQTVGVFGGDLVQQLITVADPVTTDFRFRLFYPLDGDSTCVISSGSISVELTKFGVVCTQAAINAGVCAQTSFSQSVTVVQTLPDLVFDFGPGACDERCPVVQTSQYRGIVQTTLECGWDCSVAADQSAQNRVLYTACNSIQATTFPVVAFIESFEFQIIDPDAGALDADNTESGSFYSSSATLSGDYIDGVLFSTIVDGVRTFVFDPPILQRSGEDVCVTLSIYRNERVFVGDNVIESRFNVQLPCSGNDVKQEFCSFADMRSTFFAANFTRIPPVTATGTSAYLCPEPCSLSNVPEGLTGGVVFLDVNGNGVFDSGESPIPGIFVQLVNALNGVTVSTSATSVQGVFSFDVDAIFAAGIATRMFYRIQRQNFPAGTVATIIGFQTPTRTNSFSGDPYVSPVFTRSTVVQHNAGFAVAGSSPGGFCEGASSEFDDDGVVLDVSSSTCSSCIDSAPFVGVCSAGTCSGTAVHKVLGFTYSLSNFGESRLPGTSVRVELRPTGGTVLRCADANVVNMSPNLFLVDKGISRKHHNAFAAIGWRSLPVGEDVYTFTVQFSYCSEDNAVTLNNTAIIYGDYCVDLLRRWRTCDESDPDFRECYSEVLLSGTETCDGCDVLPPSPTPAVAPVFGPMGSNTPIATELSMIYQKKMCVTKRRIEKMFCDDLGAATAQCQSSFGRGVVVVSAQFSVDPRVASSERGTATLVVKRQMDIGTLFCRDFDMEIRLIAVRNGTEVEGLFEAVESDVDVGAQEMTFVVGFNRIENGTVLILEARAMECIGDSAALNYTASLALNTARCSNATLCTDQVATFSLREQPCSPNVHDDAYFASSVNPRFGAVKRFSLSRAHGDSTLIYGLVVFLAVVFLCGCACLCFFLSSQERAMRQEVRVDVPETTGMSKPHGARKRNAKKKNG